MLRKIIRRLTGLKRGLVRILSDLWLNVIASGVCCPLCLRPILYRIAGNKIGERCYFSPRCFLGPGKGKLFVGGGTFINYNCWFDLADNIYIGEKCNIAMNVHFINGSHEIGTDKKRAGAGITRQIHVGDGTWIGADSIILPGVTIGNGVIIGAGSLVNSDCEDNSIYFGRPARLYKRL